MPDSEAERPTAETEPQADEQNTEATQDGDAPASPKHVFDDDIEMAANAANTADDSHNQSEETRDAAPRETPDEADGADDLSHDGAAPTYDVDETLFSSLYETPASAPGLVSAWMDHIQTNGPAAVASILSLVLSLARPFETPPPDLMTPETVMANKPTETVSEMFGVVSADAPGRVLVTAKDAGSRRVRRAYEDFWRRIAAEASPTVLYDCDCFDTLTTWLEAMASSPSRSLRLAACLAAYRLVDGLVEAGNKLRRELATAQRQLNTEKRRCGIDDRRRKKETRALSNKGKDLARKVDIYTANNSELTELTTKVYTRIFVFKFRDVSPDIRNASVSALGGWILAFPDHFLEDNKVKYIGWLLFDKDPAVRKTSADVLTRMLKKKDFYPNLEDFLQRFCPRVAQMTQDKDDSVCVAAITVLSCLVDKNIIEREGCELVCDTAIEETHPEIRRAAGEFMARLIMADGSEIQGGAVPKRGRPSRQSSDGIFNAGLREIPPPERSRDHLKELLFAITRKEGESEDHVTPFLAVDAVWDCFPAIRCWEAFTNLLVEKEVETAVQTRRTSSKRRSSAQAEEPEDAMSDNDRAMLCEMLLASAKEASGNGDASRARVVDKGERLNPETPGVLLTQHLLPMLPKLLNQFQADPRALCALVQLPTHFTPKCFEQDGQEKHFEALLSQIVDALSRNTASTEVTAACGATLRALLSEQNPLRQKTVTALQKACTSAAKDLTLQVRANLSDAEPDTVASAILRVRILSELIDPGTPILDSVLKVLEYQERNADTSDLGDEVSTDAARTACALVIWLLSKTRSRIESLEGANADVDRAGELEEVQDARSHGLTVVRQVHRACSSSSLSIKVRVTCLQALLTLLTLARGIEKFALSNAEDKASGEGNKLSERDPPDLLGIGDDLPELVRSVKTCVLALVEHQLRIKDHSLLLPQQRRRNNTSLPDADVRNCFASLVQASFQSLVSNEVSHLPLLGLLLKRRRDDEDLHSAEYAASQLCQQYCQQRQLRESSLIKDEARVLREVATISAADKKKQAVVRELTKALLSSRQHNDLKVTAARDLLRSLMDSATEKPIERLPEDLSLLCNAGFVLVPVLSQEHAKALLTEGEKLHNEVDHLKADSEALPAEAFLFGELWKGLKSVSTGEEPDFKKAVVRSRTLNKRSKKRRRSSGDSRASHAYASPSQTEPSNVRRSSREKKKVDYARLEDGLISDEDDEDSSAAEDDDESIPDSEEPQSQPADAAEIARNLMKFTNSPSVPARKVPSAVPESSLSPRKRRKGSTGAVTDQPPRQTSTRGSSQTEDAGPGTRGSRGRRLPARPSSESSPKHASKESSAPSETNNGGNRSAGSSNDADELSEALDASPATPSPRKGSRSRRAASQLETRSPRKAKSPANGRVQKSRKGKGQNANGFSQDDKENIEESPPTPSTPKTSSQVGVARIRRRKKRQW